MFFKGQTIPPLGRPLMREVLDRRGLTDFWYAEVIAVFYVMCALTERVCGVLIMDERGNTCNNLRMDPRLFDSFSLYLVDMVPN